MAVGLMNQVREHRWLILALLVTATYVGAYVCLSRRGYAEAKAWDAPGFYYFAPENTNKWRWRERAAKLVFWPLNQIDQWFGFGQSPAHEPLFDLSRLNDSAIRRSPS
jgi:hypothetical protein